MYYLAFYHDGDRWRAHSNHKTPRGATKAVEAFKRHKIVPVDPDWVKRQIKKVSGR